MRLKIRSLAKYILLNFVLFTAACGTGGTEPPSSEPAEKPEPAQSSITLPPTKNVIPTNPPIEIIHTAEPAPEEHTSDSNIIPAKTNYYKNGGAAARATIDKMHVSGERWSNPVFKKVVEVRHNGKILKQGQNNEYYISGPQNWILDWNICHITISTQYLNTQPAGDTEFVIVMDDGTIPFKVTILEYEEIKWPEPEALPEGNNGIAAGYKNDEGIENHPSVVLFDHFNDYTQHSQLFDNTPNHLSKWRFGGNPEHMHFDSANTFNNTGKSLRLTVPEGTTNWLGYLHFIVEDPDLQFDKLHLRFYHFVDESFKISGSAHMGGGIHAQYLTKDRQSTPGIPADGYNKFGFSIEPDNQTPFVSGSAGLVNVYAYYPGQANADANAIWGDHLYPDGTNNPAIWQFANGSLHFWGPNFIPKQRLPWTLGEWNCYEIMVQANTLNPGDDGNRDGRITVWKNGEIVLDFPNMVLRHTGFKINEATIGTYAANNTGPETFIWFDNVVIATEYIGPAIR